MNESERIYEKKERGFPKIQVIIWGILFLIEILILFRCQFIFDFILPGKSIDDFRSGMRVIFLSYSFFVIVTFWGRDEDERRLKEFQKFKDPGYIKLYTPKKYALEEFIEILKSTTVICYIEHNGIGYEIYTYPDSVREVINCSIDNKVYGYFSDFKKDLSELTYENGEISVICVVLGEEAFGYSRDHIDENFLPTTRRK